MELIWSLVWRDDQTKWEVITVLTEVGNTLQNHNKDFLIDKILTIDDP